MTTSYSTYSDAIGYGLGSIKSYQESPHELEFGAGPAWLRVAHDKFNEGLKNCIGLSPSDASLCVNYALVAANEAANRSSQAHEPSYVHHYVNVFGENALNQGQIS